MSIKKKKKSKARETARVYYGFNKETGERLYWTVKVIPAKQSVTVTGSVIDALNGMSGDPVGCFFANCSRRNSAAFPHPVKLPSFTASTAIMVTKFSRGKAVEGVKYAHSYGDFTDLNDIDDGATWKEYVKAHPEMVEREFTFRPPRERVRSEGNGLSPRNRDQEKPARHHKVRRGALLRAVKAGYASPGLLNAGFQ